MEMFKKKCKCGCGREVMVWTPHEQAFYSKECKANYEYKKRFTQDEETI